jgi:hypothetical protein
MPVNPQETKPVNRQRAYRLTCKPIIYFTEGSFISTHVISSLLTITTLPSLPQGSASDKTKNCDTTAYSPIFNFPVTVVPSLNRKVTERKLRFHSSFIGFIPESGQKINENLSDQAETFEKCSILFKVKEGKNFNHRHTLSIPRIKI